jgi:RimJ/RimL family protein N-acetyltransferase
LSLRLDPMTDTQFASYVEATCADYARTSPHYRDRPLPEALAEVRESFENRLPRGRSTPGSHFLAVILTDESGEHQVGHFEIGETPTGSKKVYIWSVAIDPEVRGRGLGKAAVRLALEYLRAQGYAKVGLNVFADNAVARKIYDDAGFVTTQMNMEKKL